jgi:hypothetical protein
VSAADEEDERVYQLAQNPFKLELLRREIEVRERPDTDDAERDEVRREIERVFGGAEVNEHGLSERQLAICRELNCPPAAFARLAARRR